MFCNFTPVNICGGFVTVPFNIGIKEKAGVLKKIVSKGIDMINNEVSEVFFFDFEKLRDIKTEELGKQYNIPIRLYVWEE